MTRFYRRPLCTRCRKEHGPAVEPLGVPQLCRQASCAGCDRGIGPAELRLSAPVSFARCSGKTPRRGRAS